MTDIAVRVESLSKQYRIGGPQARYKTIRESLAEAAQAPFRRLSSVVRGQSSAVSNETIWALKDVSFEVQRGEVVGIIGRNGAGENYTAQSPFPHHRTDGGAGRDPRTGGFLAGGGHGLPPRADRAGEHLPERHRPFDKLRTGLGMKRADVFRGSGASPTGHSPGHGAGSHVQQMAGQGDKGISVICAFVQGGV
jgi:hypothetical protein